MSDYHRDMPELAGALDRIFGLHRAPLEGVEPGVEFDTLREDIETCSRAALTPAPSPKERA